MSTITPFLWYDTGAEDAAEFYVSLFPDSKVTSVSRMGDAAMSVSFVLDGVQFQALNAGPQFHFTEAFSMFVSAPTQDRIDELWEKLTADGGEESQCGWLKDRWGLSWQIIPPVLGELMGSPDRDGAQRAITAMLGMKKLDIAGLQAAFDG